MRPSPLPRTGYCHLCNAPTSNLFCSRAHGSTYQVYVTTGRDPSTWQPRREAKQPAVKQQEPRISFPAPRLDDATKARINDVVAEAERKGTSCRLARLASERN